MKCSLIDFERLKLEIKICYNAIIVLMEHMKMGNVSIKNRILDGFIHRLDGILL